MNSSLLLVVYSYRRYVTFFIISLTCLMGCQSTSNSPSILVDHANYYVDEQFAGYEDITVETPEEIFALDDSMKALVNNKLKLEPDIEKRARKLLKHLFSEENIGIAYNSHANLTARQTFHSAKANCMSLTVMSYALTQAADIPVNFQQVHVPEYWVRSGNYNMLTGHVNLLINYDGRNGPDVLWGARRGEIDFDPTISKQAFKREIVTKNTILAMFYNNKGAQALAKHEFTRAYAYLKAATRIDPQFSSSWANLAILYRFNDLYEPAEQIYLHAIELDPNNLTAKTNLAVLYRHTNRVEQAKAIEVELESIRAKNPYYHTMLADEALYRGNLEQALTHAKRALKLNRKNHETHLMLSKIYYLSNDLVAARRAMERAIKTNHIADNQVKFLAKLNFLKQAEARYQ